MGPRITLDTSLALARAVGAWGGVDAKDLRGQISRINAAHAAITGAGDGAWPHLAGLAHTEATAWASARRAAGERIVVVGEPGMVGAVLAVAASASPGVDRIRGLDSLDAWSVETAFAGEGPVHLLVLPGPDWVAELAEAVASRALGWTVAGPEDLIAGAGTLPALPAAPYAATSPVAWALAGLAGHDPAELAAEIGRTAQRCAAPALFENPAYLMAAVVLACRERGANRLALLIPTPRLLPWAAWAERAWGSICARRELRGGVTVPVGTQAFTVQLGDEARMQQLAGGPMETVSLALWAEDPGRHWTLPGGLPGWERVRALHQAQVRLFAHGGRPVVQLRMPSLSASWLASLSFLTLHSALVVALGGEGDPRSAPARELWRDALRGDTSSG